MAKLVQIGNSQGIRIPKPIVEQAKLENVEVEVVKEGLWLKPLNAIAREGWENSIANATAKTGLESDEGLVSELLDDSDLDAWEW